MTLDSALQSAISKHAAAGILVDTNLLLLYLVGVYDREFVGTFKRTQNYTGEDFDSVAQLIHRFRRIITTPHILSELSNLSLGIKGDRGIRYFATLVQALRQTREIHVEKDELLENGLLSKLGFTDLSILEAAKQHKYLVLTDDFPATGYLRSAGCTVVNLNQIREIVWSR
jgi:rRNA-processing protein FCF1